MRSNTYQRLFGRRIRRRLVIGQNCGQGEGERGIEDNSQVYSLDNGWMVMPLTNFRNTEEEQFFMIVSPLKFVKLLFSYESHDIHRDFELHGAGCDSHVHCRVPFI